MMTFDATLDGYHPYEYVQDWARGFVWGEESISEQNIRHKDHKETIEGIEIWYDYACDHYFFAPENLDEWKENIDEECN